MNCVDQVPACQSSGYRVQIAPDADARLEQQRTPVRILMIGSVVAPRCIKVGAQHPVEIFRATKLHPEEQEICMMPDEEKSNSHLVAILQHATGVTC